MVIGLTILNLTRRQLSLERILTSNFNVQWSPSVQDTGQPLEASTALVTTLTGPDNEAFGGELRFVCDELRGMPTFSVTVEWPPDSQMQPVVFCPQTPGGPFKVEVEYTRDGAGNWNVAATVKVVDPDALGGGSGVR